MILSVPGYHNKDNLNRYGHMQLRNVIREKLNNNNNDSDNKNNTQTSTSSEKNSKNVQENTNRAAYYQV